MLAHILSTLCSTVVRCSCLSWQRSTSLLAPAALERTPFSSASRSDRDSENSLMA